jgi:hypothetical protein
VLSQVLEDRKNNVNLSQSRRRPSKTKGGKAPAKPGNVASANATPGRPDATPTPDAADGDFEQQLAEGKMLPFAGAQRVKENYLARQRAVDFAKDAGRLVERAAANKAFFDEAPSNGGRFIVAKIEVARRRRGLPTHHYGLGVLDHPLSWVMTPCG